MKKEKKIRCCLTLSPTEYSLLKDFCNNVGFSMSQYVGALIRYKVPRAVPDQTFWKRMKELYAIHDFIKINADNENIFLGCEELEEWIIKFQEDFTVPTEEK